MDYLSSKNQSLHPCSLFGLSSLPFQKPTSERFLHFHPVLVPFLRHQAGADEDAALLQRYTQRYSGLANYLFNQLFQHPQPVYALIRRELPNLQRALDLLLHEGEVDAASDMADSIARFLTNFGLTRERDQLRQRVENAVAAAHAAPDGTLTHAEYLREIGKAEDERNRGNLRAAYTRLTTLLTRIQAQPEGADVGPDSLEHSSTLVELGCCLRDAGQFVAAEEKHREALAMLDALLKQEPESHTYIRKRAITLSELGTVLREQGKYAQAQGRNYRRRERETFAAFAGNRYLIDQQFADLIAAIAAATRGDAQARTQVEAALPQLEDWGWHISMAVQRIWAGECDWQVLAEGVDRDSALLILRVLETLEAQPSSGEPPA